MCLRNKKPLLSQTLCYLPASGCRSLDQIDGSDDKVVGNDIKMNLCNKIKDKYVNSARSLQGAG
jgi:hypothetical protein